MGVIGGDEMAHNIAVGVKEANFRYCASVDTFLASRFPEQGVRREDRRRPMVLCSGGSVAASLRRDLLLASSFIFQLFEHKRVPSVRERGCGALNRRLGCGASQREPD